ncbi:type 2 lanthipeptide synthetase LanM family protein [Lysobacter enzymogenes]|uniref:type 2 lanthipeptide synthetase LanM family protein n=1 Tax=Lysobacter enzymogenes TaxID=69 RepID=UPI001AF30806|nr:type 2 lanthipeptide synthetase LanM family protein [Lysobacter enzymogenes]QQQ00666.1 type 2 lantipeptide synthetase LanM family protein [Lysobacter enzymogenes]
MSEPAPPDAFGRIVDRYVAASRAAFADCLASLPLDRDEAALAQAAADEALRGNARLKLNRVLLLELHAARRAGQLDADDDAERFAQFVELALQPQFDPHLDQRYPPLRPRLLRALELQSAALQRLMQRFVADRDALAGLLGAPAGPLRALALGQGDLHEGGQTVARLQFDAGNVMYKPRSLRIDAALDGFLAALFPDDPQRVRVPAVLDRGDYGWAAFVAHRYCDGDAELARFYRGLGHWLAALRLLGGTDIHLENLIAAGPVPVVIDVESLFEIVPPLQASGYGQAYDFAQALIRNSVLRTGIVPFRTQALGMEGVDISAAGSLPDQQPKVRTPIIAEEGTPRARLALVEIEMATAQNHPSPNPDVSRYWDCISDGFLELTAQLRALDRDGALAPLLARFAGCRVREIRRPTRAYVEIGRMLWHPASLHKEDEAIERARDLFARNSAMLAGGDGAAGGEERDDPQLRADIQAEIDALRYGDVPIFVAPLQAARIDAALDDWRAMRLDLEELTIRSALVATDLNLRMRYREEERGGRRYAAQAPHARDLDARRRRLAAEATARLLRLAVRGDDGSTVWITPEISRQGWLVQPVRPDLYFGLGGIALALAGYLHEVGHGRADPVEGLEAAMEGAVSTLRTMQALETPDTVGAFTGHASQVWTWLSLHDLLRRPELLDDALACARALEARGFEDDDYLDVIDGSAGAIVPLLALAEASGDARWRALAVRAAQRLEATAIVDEAGARWAGVESAVPSNGFSHGATGVAWALSRLVLAGAGDAAQRARWSALADAAFGFQESYYEEAAGDWRDARESDGGRHSPTWCHGSVGIGLCACDLYARTGEARHLRTMRRAVASARGQWGSSHTLCHGDMSLHELFARAAELDPQGCGGDPDESAAQIVSAIEEHRGMVGGLTRAAFTPGLMTGLAGAIHGLNRLHPGSTLASPLLLERRVGA